MAAHPPRSQHSSWDTILVLQDTDKRLLPDKVNEICCFLHGQRANHFITEGRQACKTWFALGKNSTLSIPNCLHMASTLKRTVPWFSSDWKLRLAVFEDGYNICPSQGVKRTSWLPLFKYSTAEYHYSISQFPWYTWMQPIWSHGLAMVKFLHTLSPHSLLRTLSERFH